MSKQTCIERLEGRLLMAATLRGGILKLTGTTDDDSMTVALNGTSIDVAINGESTSFAAADLTRGIRANGLAGDDIIQIDAGLAVPARLTGGGGDDELVGGAGIDLVNGGKGDDDLDGGGATDRLLGGKGQDVFQSTDAADELADFEED